MEGLQERRAGRQHEFRIIPCTPTFLTGESFSVFIKRQTVAYRVLGMNVKGKATVRAVRRLCCRAFGHSGDGTSITHGDERRYYQCLSKSCCVRMKDDDTV